MDIILQLCNYIAQWLNNTDSFLGYFAYNYTFYSLFFGIDLVTTFWLIYNRIKGNCKSNILILFLIRVTVIATYINQVEADCNTVDGINILWGISMFATALYGISFPLKFNALTNYERYKKQD